MEICIVTPAPPGSLKGNRVTAERWARLLDELGHRVRVVERWAGEPAEVLVALHARKSFASLEAYARHVPEGARIVALTGTDVYDDIDHDGRVHRSLELAWRLVVLQPAALDRLPETYHDKARVIRQSVRIPAGVVTGSSRGRNQHFDLALLAHLRPVKDPFRAAEAARLLPPSSRIRILHAGDALSEEMAVRARDVEARCPRYRWLGPLPRPDALKMMADCRAMVLTSELEGGANVVSEALALGVPVLSTRIEGSEGILGSDYRGFFPVGDTAALTDLLHRIETDAAFLSLLERRCRELQPLTEPARERNALRDLLDAWEPAA